MIGNSASNSDILFEGIVGCIDHDRRIEAAVDTLVRRFFIAVVEVYCKKCVGENGVRGANNVFQHQFVGVLTRTLGNLNDERRLRINGSLEQTHRLLGIVNIVSAESVLSVGVFEQDFSRNNHKTLL